jgi:hypothetical protein
VAVGSAAHRARRFWTNLAPATLISAMIQEAGSYALWPDEPSTVQIGTLSPLNAPAALGSERERTCLDNPTWTGPSVNEANSRPLLKRTMDFPALTFMIGSAMCFQHAFFPLWDSTILAEQYTLRLKVCHFRMLPHFAKRASWPMRR